ncbi:MAG: hypothetical protein Q9222_007716 [Ikaeria aurantiellina]
MDFQREQSESYMGLSREDFEAAKEFAKEKVPYTENLLEWDLTDADAPGETDYEDPSLNPLQIENPSTNPHRRRPHTASTPTTLHHLPFHPAATARKSGSLRMSTKRPPPLSWKASEAN